VRLNQRSESAPLLFDEVAQTDESEPTGRKRFLPAKHAKKTLKFTEQLLPASNTLSYVWCVSWARLFGSAIQFLGPAILLDLVPNRVELCQIRLAQFPTPCAQSVLHFVKTRDEFVGGGLQQALGLELTFAG
jgi:hypothetical protein